MREEAQGLAAGLRRYIEMTLLDEWQALAKGQADQRTHGLYLDLTDRFRNLDSQDTRDERIIGSIQTRLAPWAHFRGKRISWGLTRIPVPLWYLLLFIAVGIQILVILYPTDDLITHLLTVILTGGILGWCQCMIHDLDNPFEGYWCLSPASFEEVRDRLSVQRQNRLESLASAA
jgi:hypothetical protein